MNWCCIDSVDQSLPILSTAPQKTAIYKKHFPTRSIHKLYSCATEVAEDCVEEVVNHAINMASKTTWTEALSIARNADLYFDGYFPDVDGIVFITPDTDHFHTNAHVWQAKNPARRIVRVYSNPTASKHRASIHYFRSIQAECDFLQAQNAIPFTKNLVLRQRLNWQRGAFTKFPGWRYTQSTINQTILQDMSFAQKLEFVAPNKHDTLYKYMKRLSEFAATADFFRTLRDLLLVLEESDYHDLCELLFTTQPIVLCGLEEGEWPDPSLSLGKVLIALLRQSNVIATSAIDGYGRLKLNCWSSFCARTTSE